LDTSVTKKLDHNSECNRKFADRVQRGFKALSAEFLQMFEKTKDTDPNKTKVAA